MKVITHQEAADELIRSDHTFPVDFDLAWKWIGYSRKDNAKAALRDNFIEDTDFLLLNSQEQKEGSGGHNREQIHLTLDCFKAFCMMAGTAKGKEGRAYLSRRDNELLEIDRRHYEELPAEVPDVNRLTVLGFIYLIAEPARWTEETIIELGNMTRRLGKALGIEPKRVPHNEFGSVYEWPSKLLSMAFLGVARQRGCPSYPPFLALPPQHSGASEPQPQKQEAAR